MTVNVVLGETRAFRSSVSLANLTTNDTEELMTTNLGLLSKSFLGNQNGTVSKVGRSLFFYVTLN